ncbi:hypothetical protein [Allohahella sp. A8]|uniref:hypothetical protein n=1 Tax=Allohahella sp. A8 TaxID=3141461 RepID=UPI003A81065A
MSTKKDPLTTGAVGSGRTRAHTVKTQRLDVHINFIEPGGSATIVGSADGVNFGPYLGIAPFTDSGVIGLDLAEDTSLAVEYTGVTGLAVHVLPYSLRQI